MSTYIHPIDDDNLLTIGIAGGADGLGLDWSITQVSLFDVSDTSNPSLSDTLPLTPAYVDDNCEDIMTCGWSWSYSEATYEHKAFTFWAPESLLAVPLSTHRYVYDEIEIEGKVYSHYGYEYVSMLKMIDIDTENGPYQITARLSTLSSTTRRACQVGGQARRTSGDRCSWGLRLRLLSWRSYSP